MMDILYLGEIKLCEEAEKLIATAIPDAKFEYDYDCIHDHRLVVNIEPDEDRSKERAYIKFMLKEGYGNISFLIQMHCGDKDGVAFLRPILDEIKAEPKPNEG